MARIKFSELAKQSMKPDSKPRSRKAANREIAAMELSELRDTFKVTQLDLAGRMKVSQAAISKLEKPNRNIHVDQLRSIVSAMGGNLRIIADFEDRKIELSHIGKVENSPIKKTRRHKASRSTERGRALRSNPGSVPGGRRPATGRARLLF
jgi:transcriptional regulator with XRE-family HTH domain